MTRQFRSLSGVFTLALLVMVAASVLVAGAQPRSGTVVMATQSDAARLDPAATGDVPSMLVQSVMFEGLVGWDKDQKLVPQLAESWTISDGGKVLTWKLRQGVKFHDGEEFDAPAAKVNFDRWLDKANGLLTLSQFASVESVEAVDKHTLKMTLKEPNGALLQTLAGRRAMFNSPKALAKWGTWNGCPRTTSPSSASMVTGEPSRQWRRSPSSPSPSPPRGWPCWRRGTRMWRPPSLSRT